MSKHTSKLEEILKIETKDLGSKVLKLIDVNQAKADLLAWHREEVEAVLDKLERHIGDLHMERIGVPEIDNCTPRAEQERRQFNQAIDDIRASLEVEDE